MYSINSKKGISRLKDAWFLSFAGETKLLKDANYGGDRRRSRAAAIIERFKLELIDRSDEYNFNPGKQGLISRNFSEQIIVTGVWKDDQAYYVSLTKYEPDKSGKQALFFFDTFGEDNARWLAVYLRHIYNHFFYGEMYHENRNGDDLNLPTDELLAELGIPAVPDIPMLIELHPEKYPDPKVTPNEDSSNGRAKRGPTLMTCEYDTDTYKDYDFPRVQGVSYSPAAGAFYGSVPLNKKKGFQIGDNPEAAYRNALKFRHYKMLEVHGEEYNEIRNDPDNFHPSDELLERFNIPLTPKDEKNLFSPIVNAD